MELNSLEELLNDNLKDIYNAENQLLKALPKMSKNASSDSLREAFDNHLQETEMQVKRLEQIGDILGVKLSGKKCMAMEGLLEEGSELLKSKGEEAVLDLGLIGAAQRVEHYEISAYGTARTFAERLGMSDVAELLQESLDEEEAADKKLTQISEQELLSESPRENGKRGKSMGRQISGNGKRQAAKSIPTRMDSSQASEKRATSGTAKSSRRASAPKAASKSSGPAKAKAAGKAKRTAGTPSKSRSSSKRSAARSRPATGRASKSQKVSRRKK